MRIAIISDIHGNFIALQAVIAEIEKEHVDQIVCLGDVAFNGPQPRQVIQRLKEFACPVVMGNTDEFLFNLPTPEPNNENDQRIVDVVHWAIAQLSPDDVAFVKTFQPRVELSLENGKLLCFHGSPNSNKDLILATTPDAELARFFDHYRSAVMAGGHSHTQMFRRYLDAMLINPGSVGMPFERDATGRVQQRSPRAEFAILNASGSNLSVDLRRVTFDLDALLRAARANGMPHVERWAGEWGA